MISARKLLGLVVALLGIGLCAFLTAATLILAFGKMHGTYGGWERFALTVIAIIGIVAGYGIYRLGRWIAR